MSDWGDALAELNQIAALFLGDVSVISRHLRNVFHDDGLKCDSVVAFFAAPAAADKT